MGSPLPGRSEDPDSSILVLPPKPQGRGRAPSLSGLSQPPAGRRAGPDFVGQSLRGHQMRTVSLVRWKVIGPLGF